MAPTWFTGPAADKFAWSRLQWHPSTSYLSPLGRTLYDFTMSGLLTKQSLRHEAMLHRDRIDPMAEDAEQAARNFMDAIAPKPEQVIALYWPKGREFDTMPLLHILLEGGWVCALPVIQKGERLLRFAAFSANDAVEPGPFGLMQPADGEDTLWVEPDIFVIPMLAFDRHGHRLGYGKGYYDTTLHHYRRKKDVLAVGYAYAQQAVLFNLPSEDHDEKLDWIVTPQKALRYM